LFGGDDCGRFAADLGGIGQDSEKATCAACRRFRLTLERFGFCAFVSVPSMPSKKL
jgi:hypothetical protein